MGSHLPVQGTWVRSPVREAPTCHRQHSYWSPHALGPVLHDKRSRCNREPELRDGQWPLQQGARAPRRTEPLQQGARAPRRRVAPARHSQKKPPQQPGPAKPETHETNLLFKKPEVWKDKASMWTGLQYGTGFEIIKWVFFRTTTNRMMVRVG